MPRLSLIATLFVALIAQRAQADGLLFAYEGDVVPVPDGGFIGDVCATRCTQGVLQGVFFLQWLDNNAAEFIDIGRYIAQPPQPEPGTFWAEWRFRSDFPRPPNDTGCDAYVQVQYRQIVERIDLHGNAAVSFNGADAVFGLPLNEFYTVRFESRDGVTYTFAVDGKVFQVDIDGPPIPILGLTLMQFGGSAICNRPDDVRVRNEWDFIRCGTINDGENITESNPPPAVVDATRYPALDRFTVTFDEPAFVYIDQIDVTTTSGDVPQVLWT